MRTKELNENKGITLIALVVTIIVLLLLAGVAVNTLAGENGLINRTVSAKNKSADAEIVENIKLAYTNAQVGKYAGEDETFTDVMKNELEDIYGENSVSGITDNGNGTYTLTLNNKTYDIDANGNVTKVEESGPIITLVESIQISPTTLNLEVNQTAKIKSVTISPNNVTNKNIIWSSSNSEIAIVEVNNQGEIVVTAVAVESGHTSSTVTIKATSADGSNIDSNLCTVTVREEEVIPEGEFWVYAKAPYNGLALPGNIDDQHPWDTTNPLMTKIGHDGNGNNYFLYKITQTDVLNLVFKFTTPGSWQNVWGMDEQGKLKYNGQNLVFDYPSGALFCTIPANTEETTDILYTKPIIEYPD